MKTTLQSSDLSIEIGTSSEPSNFSLVLGGPLYQLCRRTRLSGDALEFLPREAVVITLFVWLPLLFLSVIERHTVGEVIRIPFIRDIETNVRFLVALPVLIVAELVVHRRISPLVRRFVERRIVAAEDLPAFSAAVQSALRVRNSVATELTLLILVYTLGWIWRTQFAVSVPTWYAMPEANHMNLTLAGHWYAFVSIPVFQFIMLRWYMRLIIWFRLLWQISRLKLHLSAANPDRAGGIGFLGKSSYAFAPILFAQGSLLAGSIATRVLDEGRGVLSFKMVAVGFVVFFVLIILGPLMMFTPQLASIRRKAIAEYGLIATRFVFCFENKWIRSCDLETSELPDAKDIRVMTDMDDICSNIRLMRLVPFGTDDMVRLAVTAAAPLLPLLLMIYPASEIGRILIKMLFR